MGHQYTFYIDPDDIAGEIATFNLAESHHLSGVLRLNAGSRVEAVDGRGNRYSIKLEAEHGGRWRGVVLEIQSHELIAPLPLWIALPCLKSDRWELALEAACELGARGVWLTEYRTAVTAWTANRVEKARRKAIEALKQSGGGCLTRIEGPVKLQELLARDVSLNLCLADDAGGPLNVIRTPALLLVGPEAGFHADEEAVLSGLPVQRFSLGKRRLRSEIACVAALAQAALKIGESS